MQAGIVPLCVRIQSQDKNEAPLKYYFAQAAFSDGALEKSLSFSNAFNFLMFANKASLASDDIGDSGSGDTRGSPQL